MPSAGHSVLGHISPEDVKTLRSLPVLESY